MIDAHMHFWRIGHNDHTWPVVGLRASWRGWLNWTLGWLSDKPDAVRDAVPGGNAARFYALDRMTA